MKTNWRLWVSVFLIWVLSIYLDRLWWNQYLGIPAWDQAEYLNNALDHGRVLGILPGGELHGWKNFLDLSPKIPPLGSVVNGIVMSIVGDSPKQAAWSLSLWHGILLWGVASWGKDLRGESLGLLSCLFVSITPVLLQLRSDYLLELPLTALLTIAIWRLGCWWHPVKGGQWGQALIASVACTAALLTKQSALLVLMPILFWASLNAIKTSRIKRLQLLAGLGIVLLGIMPWFKHNWITTLGGTKRAVIESAIKEGDPSLLTLDNWTWYIRLLPNQIGTLLLFMGIGGLVLWVFIKWRISVATRINQASADDPVAWQWLICSLLAGWMLTTLSPNKDARYIAPLLPALILLLSRGWIQWGLWIRFLRPKSSNYQLILALCAGVGATIPNAWNSQISLLNESQTGPLVDIIKTVRQKTIDNPKTTLIVVPSTPDLNQHNVSFFGRRQGGQLIGRQLGNNQGDIKPLLEQAQWILLAEGDYGSVRNSALLTDKAIRTSGLFYEVRQFPRKHGNSYSLWHRREDAPPTQSFSSEFPKLARTLTNGPSALNKVFNKISIQHMLDGHFQYQIPVKKIALMKLEKDKDDIDSYWTLALLSVLNNRPTEADYYFSHLVKLLPGNPWPSTYQSFVNLAGWNPLKAAAIADKAQKSHKNLVLAGLGDLGGLLSGAIWRLPSASNSIPKAITQVEESMGN